MKLWRRNIGDLTDALQRAIDADPGDGPIVLLEADIFADDLSRLPAALEPVRVDDRSA